MRLKEVKAEAEPVAVEPATEHRIKVDAQRKASYRTICTNIMTRAWCDAEQRDVSIDIAYLDRQSLLNWLSENQERTIRTVLALLGHKLSE